MAARHPGPQPHHERVTRRRPASQRTSPHARRCSSRSRSSHRRSSATPLSNPSNAASADPPRSSPGCCSGASAMALADARAARRARARLREASAVDGLLLGLAQTFALIPGVSRSGAVLAAARARGFSRVDSGTLARRTGLPVILGAGALKTGRLLQRGARQWDADLRCAAARRRRLLLLHARGDPAAATGSRAARAVAVALALLALPRRARVACDSSPPPRCPVAREQAPRRSDVTATRSTAPAL